MTTHAGEPFTEPWEQLPEESDPAWQAFRAYRDAKHGERSLVAVAQELGKAKSLISRWSSRHSWQLRVQAYERHLDHEWRAALVSERRERDQRNLRISDALIAKVVQGLQSLDASRLSARDVASMFDTATKIQRLITGDPTSIEATAVSREFEQLSPEERRERLRAVIREAERRLTRWPSEEG